MRASSEKVAANSRHTAAQVPATTADSKWAARRRGAVVARAASWNSIDGTLLEIMEVLGSLVATVNRVEASLAHPAASASFAASTPVLGWSWWAPIGHCGDGLHRGDGDWAATSPERTCIGSPEFEGVSSAPVFPLLSEAALLGGEGWEPVPGGTDTPPSQPCVSALCRWEVVSDSGGDSGHAESSSGPDAAREDLFVAASEDATLLVAEDVTAPEATDEIDVELWDRGFDGIARAWITRFGRQQFDSEVGWDPASTDVIRSHAFMLHDLQILHAMAQLPCTKTRLARSLGLLRDAVLQGYARGVT